MSCDATNNQAFNIGETIPKISYSCVSYLVNNNELIWKLLKDKTPDAWNIGNVSKSEKSSMIYNGIGDMNNFHVFIDDNQDDAFNTETTYIRIYPMQEIAINRLMTSVDVCMVVYTHANCNHLSNYETRVERVIQQFKETFNGKDIPSVGQLVYDGTRSRSCKAMIVGRTPFKGKAIVFNVLASSVV